MTKPLLLKQYPSYYADILQSSNDYLFSQSDAVKVYDSIVNWYVRVEALKPATSDIADGHEPGLVVNEFGMYFVTPTEAKMLKKISHFPTPVTLEELEEGDHHAAQKLQRQVDIISTFQARMREQGLVRPATYSRAFRFWREPLVMFWLLIVVTFCAAAVTVFPADTPNAILTPVALLTLAAVVFNPLILQKLSPKFVISKAGEKLLQES